MVLEPKTDTQLGGSVCTTHRAPRLALLTYIERAIQAELSQSFSVLPDKHSLPQVKAKSKNLLAWNLSAVGFGRHNSGMESARGLSS